MKQIQLFFFTALALIVFVAIADLGSALAQTNPVKKEEDPNLQRINGREDFEGIAAEPGCPNKDGSCWKNRAPLSECGSAPNQRECPYPNGNKTQPSKSSPATTAQ